MLPRGRERHTHTHTHRGALGSACTPISDGTAVPAYPMSSPHQPPDEWKETAATGLHVQGRIYTAVKVYAVDGHAQIK